MTDRNVVQEDAGRLRPLTALAGFGLLTAMVGIVYFQTNKHEFVAFDDPQHIYENKHVHTGLTAANAIWAFEIHGPSQWHPLAWLSHQLDCELFGLNAGAHIMMNVAIHLLSSMLLFVALYQLTGDVFPSFCVAAIFAVHPLNVESVAWASERRNVLGGLFWMLSLCAYARYSRAPGVGRYVLLLVCFACGLMSKPTVVTLPCVLLLLDYWPIGRIAWNGAAQLRSETAAASAPCAQFDRMVWLEKIPLFSMSAVASFLTIQCQRSARVVVGLTDLPLSLRIENALISYVSYLRQMVLPTDLAMFYPYPAVIDPDADSEFVWAALCGGVLLAITVIAIRALRRRPYLAVGWFWYLGTLVPMIGVVQVGHQRMADRYVYLPMIGLGVAVCWLFVDVASGIGVVRHRYRWLVAIPIVLLMSLSWFQVGHWRDSVTLFAHAASVTKRNYLAENNLGMALSARGRKFEGAKHCLRALEYWPDYALAHYNVGVFYHDLGDSQRAEFHYRRSLELDPGQPQALVRMGVLLDEAGRYDEAESYLRKATRLYPDYAMAHQNLGILLNHRQRTTEAVASFQQAVRAEPNDANSLLHLAASLMTLNRLSEARRHFEQVLQLSPHLPAAHEGLAELYRKQGNLARSREHQRKAAALRPTSRERFPFAR